jgi:hypothetical protein
MKRSAVLSLLGQVLKTRRTYLMMNDARTSELLPCLTGAIKEPTHFRKV